MQPGLLQLAYALEQLKIGAPESDMQGQCLDFMQIWVSST